MLPKKRQVSFIFFAMFVDQYGSNPNYVKQFSIG